MKRDVVYDAVRAICILWIVGFWHLRDYLPMEYQFGKDLLHVGEIVTWGVLATFAFISGLFLSKYKFETFGDVKFFYRKRITRFFFLFFLAVISMYIAGLTFHQHFFLGGSQVLFCLLGIGSFISPNAPTFWYISMMMFFYMITPIILFPKKPLNRISISALILLILILASSFTIIDVDSRLIVYLFFYFAGLLIPKKHVDKSKNPYFLFAALLVLLIPVHNIWQSIITDALFVIFLVAFANLLCKSRLNKLFTVISYSSMAAYLFHRHIYLSFVFLFNMGSRTPLRDAAIPLWSIIIIIPIVFVLSYYIQKCYDFVYKKVSTKC